MKNKKLQTLLKENLVVMLIGSICFVLCCFISCNGTHTHLKECYSTEMPFEELPDTLQTIFLAKIIVRSYSINLDSPKTKMVYRAPNSIGFWPGKIFIIINEKEYFFFVNDIGFDSPYILYQGYLYNPCNTNFLFTEEQIKKIKFKKIFLLE